MASLLWQRIRAVRRYMKLTQEALGAELGASKSAVAQWESSSEATRTTPEVPKLVALSKLSKAPLDWLLSDESDLDHAWWNSEEHHALTDDQAVLLAAFDELLPEQQAAVLADVRLKAKENRQNFEQLQKKFGVAGVAPDGRVAKFIEPKSAPERPEQAPQPVMAGKRSRKGTK